MAMLNEEYADIYKILKNKKISTPKAEEVILRLLWRNLKEIGDSKRDKMDIGDPGRIGLEFIQDRKGWRLEIKNFLYHLTNYEGDDNPNLWGGDIWDGDPKNVERDLIKLAEKYNIPLM